MAERRLPGEGTVFYCETSNRYVWRAVVGRMPTGKVAYKTGKCKTRGEAIRRQREAEQAGKLPETDRTTVAEWLNHWLERFAATTTRESTLERYRQIVRVHLIPKLGGIKLKALTSQDISRAWSKLVEEKHSPGNIQKCSQVLSSALTKAAKEGMIPVSPSANATVPRVDRPPIEVFSDGDIAAILATVKGHRLESLFLMAIGTGMRQGELFALQWEDVSAGTVHVKRTVTSGTKIGPPKSARGVRVIDLPAFVTAAMPPSGKGFVFTSEEGGILRKSNFIRRDFAPMLAEAKIRYRKFHTFRHTHASRLLSAGVDVAEVARRLGDSIQTVMRCYAHWMPTWKGTAGVIDGIYGATRP